MSSGAEAAQELGIRNAYLQQRGLRLHAEASDLVLESAFRSVARQVEIVQAKLAAGQALEDALLLVAPPGYSEHHTGCAVDIGTPGSVALREEFETTTAFDRLRAHAARHRFKMSFPRGNAQGYSYEPWHWCFRP